MVDRYIGIVEAADSISASSMFFCVVSSAGLFVLIFYPCVVSIIRLRIRVYK